MDRNATSSRVFLLALLLSAALAIVLAPAARADTIYTYTGQSLANFSGGFTCKVGTSCPITGTLTLSQPLGPNAGGSCATTGAPSCGGFPKGVTWSWTFTDGVTTWSSSDPNSWNNPFGVQTDAKGNITTWFINLYLPGPNGQWLYLQTVKYPQGTGASDATGLTTCFDPACNSPFAYNINQPGTWTTTSTTPEPGALLLLGTGLLSVLGTVRRNWMNKRLSGGAS